MIFDIDLMIEFTRDIFNHFSMNIENILQNYRLFALLCILVKIEMHSLIVIFSLF
jgi:hypothetical protein